MQFDPAQIDTETRSFLGAVAIAILGGIVRAIRSDKCSTRAVFVELVTSIFAGIIVFLLVSPLIAGSPYADYYRAGMAGIAGHIAPKLLDKLGAKATKIIGGCLK